MTNGDNPFKPSSTVSRMEAKFNSKETGMIIGLVFSLPFAILLFKAIFNIWQHDQFQQSTILMLSIFVIPIVVNTGFGWWWGKTYLRRVGLWVLLVCILQGSCAWGAMVVPIVGFALLSRLGNVAFTTANGIEISIGWLLSVGWSCLIALVIRRRCARLSKLTTNFETTL